MLQVNDLIGFGVSSSPPSLSYQESDTTSATTISGISFGEAASNRYVIAALGWIGDSGGVCTLNSCSIGGVSGTISIQNADAVAAGISYNSAIVIALVPSGASGDVACSFSSTITQLNCSSYRAINIDSSSAFNTSSDDAQPISMSLNIPGDGIAVACAQVSANGNMSISGLDEDFDDNARFISGSSSLMVAEASRSITISYPIMTISDSAGVCASFR